MTALVKHATVLHWFESLNRNPWLRGEHMGPQTFVSEEPVPDTETPGVVIRVPYETWQDMGGPLTITVTVEPGDRLNEDQE